MIVKNKKKLTTSEIRRNALDIIETGIRRVLPSTIMHSAIKYDIIKKVLEVNGDTYPVSNRRIFVVGGGKASGLMAKTLEEIIQPVNITDGIVICTDKGPKSEKIKLIPASHPIPDSRGVNGVQKILRLKEQYTINEKDLILCLISGGGSALMPCPADGLNLEEKMLVTRLLISCGADIKEINTVRKHLSGIKGGRLGQYFHPATVISLIISDVVGNDLSVIASGPTFPDSSTFIEAYEVLTKYKLLSKVPKNAISHLVNGFQGLVEETPKHLDNCHNYLIGDNNIALQAMSEKASELGFHPYILTSQQKGDTTEVAQCRAKEIMETEYPPYSAILIGGETTVKLPDLPGRGGRNQHYVAASLIALDAFDKEWVLASVGTDGADFLPGVAGAIIDNSSLRILKKKGLDFEMYIKNFDSYSLLKQLGNSIIVTGKTGTNVSDIILYILGDCQSQETRAK